jgi:hypothetical protein
MAAAFEEEFDPAAPPWSAGPGESTYLERAQLWLPRQGHERQTSPRAHFSAAQRAAAPTRHFRILIPAGPAGIARELST